MRLAGDAEDLRARTGVRRARADALAVQDVQLRFRALPQDAREVSRSEVPRTRTDLVGEHRSEPHRSDRALSERPSHTRWPDRPLPERLSQYVRGSLRRVRAQRVDARRGFHARLPDAAPQQAAVRQRLQRSRRGRTELYRRPDHCGHPPPGGQPGDRAKAALRECRKVVSTVIRITHVLIGMVVVLWGIPGIGAEKRARPEAQSAGSERRRVIAPPGVKPIGPYSPGILTGDF